MPTSSSKGRSLYAIQNYKTPKVTKWRMNLYVESRLWVPQVHAEKLTMLNRRQSNIDKPGFCMSISWGGELQWILSCRISDHTELFSFFAYKWRVLWLLWGLSKKNFCVSERRLRRAIQLDTELIKNHQKARENWLNWMGRSKNFACGAAHSFERCFSLCVARGSRYHSFNVFYWLPFRSRYFWPTLGVVRMRKIFFHRPGCRNVAGPKPRPQKFKPK